MDLSKLGQFHIITYPEVDLLLIICYLTCPIFLVNFPNQFLKSTYAINLFNQSIIPLACDMLFFLTNVYT